VARHRLEPREHILEGARLDVMDPGLGIRGRRPLVEDPSRCALPRGERSMEDVGVLPEREDALLEVGEAHLRIHGFERHVDSSVHTKRLVLGARTRRVPRGTTSRCRALAGSRRSPAANTASRDHGRSRLRLLRNAVRPRPVRAGARGGCSPGARRRLPPSRLARTAPTRLLVPVNAGIGDATRPRPREAPWHPSNERSDRRRKRGPEPWRVTPSNPRPDLREQGGYALFCYPSPPWRTASSVRARSPI